VTSPSGTSHPLMLTDVPWSEIERGLARLSSARSGRDSSGAVRRRYDRPRICDFEGLLDQPSKGLCVKSKAEFTMRKVIAMLMPISCTTGDPERSSESAHGEDGAAGQDSLLAEVRSLYSRGLARRPRVGHPGSRPTPKYEWLLDAGEWR
jgi:hypothetical protein